MRLLQKTCPDRQVLVCLLNDALDDRQHEDAARHVDRCRECQASLDSICAALEGDSHESTDTLNVAAVDTDPDADSRVERLKDRLKKASWRELSAGTDVQSNDDADQASVGDADESSPPSMLGACQLEECLGSGATSHLYRATDTRLNRTVAVKILRPELAASESARLRFTREAHAIAQLNDSRIVAIHDVCNEAGSPPWIVMEFVDGDSLHDAFRRDGAAMGPEQAAGVLADILGALDVAHEAGVIHRDVKPANVLVSQADGSVKLADFGLARFDDQPVDLTAEGMLAGTPAYMSPEQILNPQKVDGRSDVYSAGVVLYELLTGDVPFRGAIRMVLEQVLHDVPPPLRRFDDRIPRDLENICLKALAKEPDRRYQSAGAFRDDLTRFLCGKPVQARPVSSLERTVLWCRRNPGLAGLTSVLVILMLAGVSGWASFTLSLTGTNDRLIDSNTSLERQNVALEAARRRARLGEAQARANAALAERQLNLAFDMVTGLVGDVQDDLGDHPELTGLRERLLQRAVGGLDQIADATSSTDAVTYSRAVALNRLGDVYRDLNQRDVALRFYDEARSLLHDSHQFESDEEGYKPNLHLLLSVTETNRGDILLRKSDFSGARTAFETALAGARTATNTDASDVSSIRQTAVVHQRLARLERDEGHQNEARKHILTAISFLERAADLTPGDVQIKSELSRLKSGAAGTQKNR